MIIITGQTATGKTSLAIEMAKKYHGEIINFDSRQIYKYLNIITGKDLDKFANIQYQISNIKYQDEFINFYSFSLNSQNESKLWLYDIVEPNQYFSSYEYAKLATKIIDDIQKRGKTPILVGGTYFYLKHLLYGFDFQIPPDFKLREKLNQKTVGELQQILKKLDSEIESKMNQSDWHNPRRLIRKIEIYQYQNLRSAFSKNKKPKFIIKKFIGLKYKHKEELKKAIEKRVEKRLQKGAIDEVKKILQLGYKKTDPGLQTIGYKQLIEYLEGKVSQKQAIENWIIAEMQYAKRQYTFMKKDKNINWQEI
ncbi:MAG: tRNA (adenosine(37)-N6)-dimethylallyltransferase MiaA [Microgenomates group bacterium]